MELMKPITAVRLLTLLVAALLAIALFVPKASSVASFLTGVALGMTIAVQVLVWQSDLEGGGSKAGTPQS